MRFFTTPYFKVLSVIVVLFIFYQECIVKHNKDFEIFIGASQLIFEGQNCYEVFLKSGSSGLKYFYSPLFAVLLYPLKDLHQYLYNFVWLVLNLFLIYRIFSLLFFFLPVNKLSRVKQQGFLLLVVACSARYILDNLDLGQMTFLLVWGSLESIKLIFEKKYFTGAAILAFIINIKIIPIALVVYLIYKREFFAVLLTSLFFVFYLYLPVIFIGYDFNSELLQNWFSSLTKTTENSIYEDACRPSLSSLIPSLFTDTEIQFSVKRNFINLDSESTNLILNAVRGGILLFLSYLFGKPFQRIASIKPVFYDLSLICLVTPLIFPHQGKYSIFYLLPAYAYVIYSIIKMQNAKKRSVYISTLTLLIASFLFVTLTTDGLIGRRLSDFTEYLHFITYGTLSLLFAMVNLKPKRQTIP